MIDQWVGHFHDRQDSVVRRLPAELKLFVGLILIVATGFAPASWRYWFVGVALFLGLVAVISRVPLTFLLKRMAWLSPLILSVAALNALQPMGHQPWWLTAVKSTLCLLTVILVSNTTPFSKILRALKRVYVPGLLITIIALMHRYLFVLVEETERMRRARACRTFTRQREGRWRLLATLVGQLFVRASERAERIYDAMCARGWK